MLIKHKVAYQEALKERKALIVAYGYLKVLEVDRVDLRLIELDQAIHQYETHGATSCA